MCLNFARSDFVFFFGVVFCPGTTGPTSWPTSLGSCPTSPVMGCWLGPMLYSTCWAKNARCSWCSWRWDGWELRAVEGCWSGLRTPIFSVHMFSSDWWIGRKICGNENDVWLLTWYDYHINMYKSYTYIIYIVSLYPLGFFLAAPWFSTSRKAPRTFLVQCPKGVAKLRSLGCCGIFIWAGRHVYDLSWLSHVFLGVFFSWE